MYACALDLFKIVSLADGTAGGRVPYLRTPRVGVIVGSPSEAVDVAVNSAWVVPMVAVAGVVVRFGAGVDEGTSVMTSAVGDGDARTGVAVSVGGTVVGEG